QWRPLGNVSAAASSLWARRLDDVWIAGGQSLERYDGTNVSAFDVSIPADESLLAVWGTDASDVWLIGVERTWHFDGAAWKQLDGAGTTASWPVPYAALDGAKGDVWLARNGVLSH